MCLPQRSTKQESPDLSIPAHFDLFLLPWSYYKEETRIGVKTITPIPRCSAHTQVFRCPMDRTLVIHNTPASCHVSHCHYYINRAGDLAFIVTAPRLWNIVNQDLLNATTLHNFKTQLHSDAIQRVKMFSMLTRAAKWTLMSLINAFFSSCTAHLKATCSRPRVEYLS